MKPIFLKHRQIDKQKWDATVNRYGSNNFYCLSWYLDAVCKEWNALIIGNYEYLLPVPTKSKGVFKIFYQPFFSRNLDIIGPKPHEGLLEEFINSLPKSYVQVMFGISGHQAPMVDGYNNELHPFQMLSLDQPLDDLQKAYSTNATRLLNKLEQNKYTYQTVTPLQVVDLFVAETAQKIEHITATDIKRLTTVFEQALQHRCGFALGAFNAENKLEAAGFFIDYQNVICYLKGASTAEGRKDGAMYGIMNQVISQHADSNKWLDFDGSRIPAIAQFFKKFGAIDHYYTFIKKDQSFLIHLSKQLYHKLKR